VGYVYVAITIALTVYGQLVIKWQVAGAGPLPDPPGARLVFLLRLLLNPWVLSGLGAALIAALAWMAALTRFDLGFAYPFMSLSFILVMFASALIFREPVTPFRVIGMALVVIGLVVSTRAR
jgi:multidrug transporter EmrE-like cation transporter